MSVQRPCLNIGEIMDIFIPSGTIPVRREQLIIAVIGTTTKVISLLLRVTLKAARPVVTEI